jgi:hypothetical protein
MKLPENVAEFKYLGRPLTKTEYMHKEIKYKLNFEERVLQYGSACSAFLHLKPTGHVTHQQVNIQQLYAMPTLY